MGYAESRGKNCSPRFFRGARRWNLSLAMRKRAFVHDASLTLFLIFLKMIATKNCQHMSIPLSAPSSLDRALKPSGTRPERTPRAGPHEPRRLSVNWAKEGFGDNLLNSPLTKSGAADSVM